MRELSLATTITTLASAALLVACGGSPSSTPTATTPGGPTGPTSMTLSGVVAKGAALANATITAKCATGTGSATSGTNGAYALSISGGVLPCVLEATSSDAAIVLHSVATGSASDAGAAANITPLTELLVAQLSGQDPATYMSSLDTSTLGASLTSSAVTTAQAAVVGTLIAAGVNTSAITSLVTDALVAANGSTTGNGYDTVLDNLSAALSTAGTTLPELTSTVAVTAAAAASQPAPTTPVADADGIALPAEVLLKAKASNCAALRNTSYRSFLFKPSDTTGVADAVTTVDSFSFDTSTLTASYANGGDVVWTAAGNCAYTANGGQSTITVSPAGVVVGRYYDSSNSTYRMGMALPMQTIAVAELAGSWNLMGWTFNGGTFGPDVGTIAVNSSGALTSSKCFDDAVSTTEANCVTETAMLPVITGNANGGFDLSSTDPSDVWKDRVFAYRAGSGDLMLVLLNAQGWFSMATPSRTLSLPAVNDVTTIWNITANVNLFSSDTVAANTHTIASVDAVSSSFTRTTQTVGSTVTQPQTMAINTARNGYMHRTAATVTASDSSTVTVREMYNLKLRGMGLTAYYLPNTSAGANSNARLGISVKQ